MRICLVAVGPYCNDPRARTLADSLAHVGHEVSVVASGRPQECPSGDIDITFVPTRYPVGRGRIGKILRRTQTKSLRQRLHHARLAEAVRARKPDIVYPTSAAAVPIAATAVAGTEGTVVRDPRWPNAGERDLVDLAPHHPELNVSPAGPGGRYLTPADQRERYTPEPGRYKHMRIALSYRKTDTNPGKYLEAAMLRSGINVDLHTDGIDWKTIPADTNAVVFVEGPYPALEIRGRNPGIPVVFWAHHGEHHIPTNIRLTERYGAHAVLLAHSWHLVHRFPVPVHRFTFGVAPELVDASVPWTERKYEVSMVGGGLRREGGAYERRQQLVADLEDAFGADNTAFVSNVSAQEMAEIYARAKTIINEGGTRHYPITMRVLESIGSGSILVTDDLPGTDLIVDRDHYFVLDDDVVSQIRGLLAQPEKMAAIAEEARAAALGLHTYDHNVDDLIEIIGGIDAPVTHKTARDLSPIAALIDVDVEVQRLAQFDLPDLAGELVSREVWDGQALIDRLNPHTMEAVVIGPAGTQHLDRALAAARRYIYAAGDIAAIKEYAARELPDATVTHHGELIRVDLNAESYRVLAHEREITT